MNDKLKTIVFIGIIICIIIGILFLLEKRSASYTDTTQIEKAAVSQEQKAKKKTEPSKDADLSLMVSLRQHLLLAFLNYGRQRVG